MAAAVVLVLLPLFTACAGTDAAVRPAGTATGGVPVADASITESGHPVADLHGKVIVIDPGHNGGNAAHPFEVNRLVDVITMRKPCDTTGAETVGGYSEHAFTWDVSARLAKILRAQGAKVVLTRGDDSGVGPCVTERAAIGNHYKADAALSVHADGAAAHDRGFHVIEPRLLNGHNDGIVAASHRLGVAIRDAYHEGTGIAYANYRGKDAIDIRDDLGGLNLSRRPKVFIECGNMRNGDDAAKLSDPKFRQRIAEALADGFTRYLT